MNRLTPPSPLRAAALAGLMALASASALAQAIAPANVAARRGDGSIRRYMARSPGEWGRFRADRGRWISGEGVRLSLSLRAAHARIEQVAQRIAEHIGGVDHRRQAQAGRQRQPGPLEHIGAAAA